MLEVIMCSKTLQQMQVRDIGRLFSALDFGPFLYTGVKKCIFPVSRDYTIRERGIIDVSKNWSNFSM